MHVNKENNTQCALVHKQYYLRNKHPNIDVQGTSLQHFEHSVSKNTDFKIKFGTQYTFSKNSLLFSNIERVAASARVAVVHNTDFAQPPFSRQMVGEGTEIGNKMEKKAVRLGWRALLIKKTERDA